MKKIAFILSLCFLCATCMTDVESEVFVGEWEDAKNPGQIWKIEKSYKTFTGTRIGSDDFYDYDTEEWTFTREDKILKLVSTKEKGSTLTYFPDRKGIMRFPPGTTYQRKK